MEATQTIFLQRRSATTTVSAQVIRNFTALQQIGDQSLLITFDFFLHCFVLSTNSRNLRQIIACGTFEVVLLSSSFGVPFDCSRTPCPTGYSCVSDVLDHRRMFCCGIPNMGKWILLRHSGTCVFQHRVRSPEVCPKGLQPVNDPRTLLPISCRGSRNDVCPPNFHCLLHPTRKRHFCCGSSKHTGNWRMVTFFMSSLNNH